MNNTCCFQCQAVENNFAFSCGHSSCCQCITLHYYKALTNVEKILQKNPSHFNNKLSCIGCPKQCAKSRLSIDLSLINEFAQSSNTLTKQDKQRFSTLSKLCVYFFSGIRCYFFICINCNTLRSSTNAKIIFCDCCMLSIYFQRLSRHLLQLKISRQDFNDIDFKRVQKSGSYFFIETNENGTTYLNDPNDVSSIKLFTDYGSTVNKAWLIIANIRYCTNEYVYVNQSEQPVWIGAVEFIFS